MRTIISILVLAFVCTLSLPVFAQSITSKGVVTDKVTGEPIAGVSVENAKTKKVLGQTDDQGQFSVSVPDGTELLFTYIGYTVIKMKVQPELAVVMSQKESAEVGVVVQGFTKKSRPTNTGSSVIISGKDLQGVPSASVADLLQGRVAGMNIQNSNGAPGGRSSIFVRGLSSINTVGSGSSSYLTPTSPLFVIDGVPVDMNSDYQYGFNQAGPGVSPLAQVPVEDIEEIQVLKDAAATALWGSKGAYGVVIITTKQGKSSVPVISYQGQVFYNTPPRLRDVIGGREERMLRIRQILQYDSTYRNALERINGRPFLSDSLNAYFNNATDWQDAFFAPTTNYSHNISVRGGQNQFAYKVNFGLYKENGIIRNTGLTRYNLNMNTRFQTKNLVINAYMNSAITKNRVGSGSGLLQNGVAEGGNASSLLPPPSLYSLNNAALGSIAIKDDNKTLRLLPSVDLQWMTPIDGLQVATAANYTLESSTSDNLKPAFINDGSTVFTSYTGSKNEWYNRNSINYIKSLKGKDGEDAHNFSAYIFNEITKNKGRNNQTRLVGTPNDHIIGPTGNNYGNTIAGILENLYDSRTFAYGGSVDYNYKLMAVLNFQYRADAASTNGPLSGYQRHPIFSGRVNLEKMPYFRDLKWLDQSSFKASYGTRVVPTGSIFDVYGKYNPGGTYNGQPTINIDLGFLPNVNYLPLTSTELNLGYEGAFFNNQLTMTYDFYYKSNENQPYENPLANTTGFDKIKTNDVSSVNYGHEIYVSVRADRSEKRDFDWSVSANAAFNKTILTHLPDGVQQLVKQDDGTGNFPILYRVGRHPFSTMVYNTAGVYATDADVMVDPVTGRPVQVGWGTNAYLRGGDPHWTDLNGDYVIDGNDLMILGDPFPKLTGGFNVYLSYKDWSFSLNGSYTLFRDVVNTALAQKFRNFGDPTLNSDGYDIVKSGVLVPIDQYQYWQKPGDVAKYPNPFDFLNYRRIDPYRSNQTLFFEDGSYWKLNTVQLTYTFKRDWLQRYGIRSANVYVSAYNALVLSKYSGSSPENVTDLGFDNPNGYPNARKYTLGVNIEL